MSGARRVAARPLATVLLLAAALLGGCGLNVQSPDLFLLTRTGPGPRLTLLYNDSGTVRCNGGQARTLPGSLLLQARDLAGSLDTDAKAHRRFLARGATVYHYTVHLQDGTIQFPDSAAGQHPDLARLELLVLQTSQQVCRLKAA